MSEPKSAAELAEAYTRSIWAPGEMYPKHMTEAFLAGHAAGRESAGELVDALDKLFADAAPGLTPAMCYQPIIAALARWKASAK